MPVARLFRPLPFAALLLAPLAGAQAPAQSPPASAPTVQAPGTETGPSLGMPPAQLNLVEVELSSTAGQRARGALRLSPTNHGLHVSGTLSGLKANGAHGFHVHETGDCSAADASSAGDHFNPAGTSHGQPGTESSHAGDLPNARADAQGEAQVNVTIAGLTLGDGGERDILGRALVLHADPDDYSGQPAGNAGARIACGVVSRPPPAATPAAAAATSG